MFGKIFSRICTFMQSFAVFTFVICLLVFGILSYPISILMILFGNAYLRAFVIVYAIWIYLERDKAQSNIKGLGVKFMRDGFFWRQFREYFPVELVKTAELPPDKNYLLACFPHGVLSFGVFTNMCADIGNWNELFPNIRVHLATLAVHFNTPIWRHFIESWAMVSASKMSLLNHLTYSSCESKSRAIGLIVGGSQEALDSKPGQYILTIMKRKGFIKLAMETGSSIVPVFTFGEVDVYDQIDNPPYSLLRKFQSYVKHIIGVSPILIKGRGLFGLLPHRKRIVQVVGAPIPVTQCDYPKEDDISTLHMHFIECLRDLFETHKAKYIENSEKVKLVMI